MPSQVFDLAVFYNKNLGQRYPNLHSSLTFMFFLAMIIVIFSNQRASWLLNVQHFRFSVAIATSAYQFRFQSFCGYQTIFIMV